MEGTLVLIAIALTVVTAAAIITAASIVVTITIAVAVVSTVAGVVSVAVVGGREARSKSGSNLHEIDEFLSSCCSSELLGVLDERSLIVRTLATEEGLLDIVLSWKNVRTRHHRGVLDEDVESNEEFSSGHGSWNVSATGTDVLDERGSIGVSADRGRDCCLDLFVLGLGNWANCWQTENRLLVRRLITESKDRLKVDNLIVERHAQGIGLSFKILQSKEVGFSCSSFGDEDSLLICAALNFGREEMASL
jgi:hypothetical protein